MTGWKRVWQHGSGRGRRRFRPQARPLAGILAAAEPFHVLVAGSGDNVESGHFYPAGSCQLLVCSEQRNTCRLTSENAPPAPHSTTGAPETAGCRPESTTSTTPVTIRTAAG